VDVDASPEPTDIDQLVVRYSGQGWALMVEDLATPAWTVSTKAKAVEAAKEIAEDCEALLVVETQNGKPQKRFDYREEN
jgi:uncharacterized protein YggE